MAEDLTTTGGDNTPTSVRDEITARVIDYRFWVGQAVSHFHPLGAFQYALLPLRYYHGYNDPSALDLPILWEHRERPLFKTIGKFRFADQKAFDFRGEGEADVSTSRTNSRG